MNSEMPVSNKNFHNTDTFVWGVLCLLMIGMFPAMGTASENQTTVELQPVEIIGEREYDSYETGDVPVSEISGFSHVITRDQFEGKLDDLASVIQKEAGIQIRRSGGVGSFSTVSIRGSTNEQVLVFIDGVLLNEAAGGGVNLSNISLSDVESIEVFRGSTPIQFGTSSIGGVVNIRTRRSRKGDKDLNLSTTLGRGSFGTSQAAVFLNQKRGKGDYLISADYLGSQGDFWYENTKNTKDSSDNHSWESRNNNSFSQYNLLLKAGYRFTNTNRIYFSNEYFKKNQELPYWNNSPNVDTKLTTIRNIFIGKFIADNIGTSGINSASRFQYSWKSELYDDRYDRIGLGAQLYEYNTEGYSFNQLFELPFQNSFVTGVLDLKHETFEARDKLNDRTFRPSKRTVGSVAVEDNIMFFDESLSLIPCVRYHHIVDRLQNSDYSEGTDDESSYFTPQFGIIWNVTSGFRLKGNMGKYVREPSFLELFGDRGFFYGNADLVAEKGVNTDMGFEFKRYGAENAFIRNVRVGLVFFNSEIENLIAFIYDARGIGKALNLSNAEIRGIETDLSFDFLEWFSFSANYTRQDAISRSSIQYANNKRLPGRYETAFNGRLEAEIGRWKCFYEILYEDGMYYDEAELLKAPTKNTHNTGFSFSAGQFTATLEVRNLTNDEYEDFHGYPRPGTAYYASVKYQY